MFYRKEGKNSIVRVKEFADVVGFLLGENRGGSKGGDKGAQGVTKLSANQVASPLVDIFLS